MLQVIEQRKQERKDAKENENKTVKKDDTLIGMFISVCEYFLLIVCRLFLLFFF